MSFRRHLLAILILPFTVTVIVPYLLVSANPTRGSVPATIGGGLLLLAGLTLVATTVWHFASRGRGTLAPWDPPRKLVVSGIYRYVRNPMISGVILILLSESLILESWRLAAWTASVFILNATYIPLVEEKGLLRRFGAEYEAYCEHVPRWIPRRTAWRQPC